MDSFLLPNLHRGNFQKCSW